MPIAIASAAFPFKGSDGSDRTGRTPPITDEGGVATVDIGNDVLATNQKTIGTTATTIVSARAGRGSITVVNHGTTDVFLGDASVTIGTGVLLLGVKGASITLPYAGALYGIVQGGTEPVSFVETY